MRPEERAFGMATAGRCTWHAAAPNGGARRPSAWNCTCTVFLSEVTDDEVLSPQNRPVGVMCKNWLCGQPMRSRTFNLALRLSMFGLRSF